MYVHLTFYNIIDKNYLINKLNMKSSEKFLKILSGILKYSTVLAKANEFGGIIHSFAFLVTKLSFLKTFGSTIPELTFVNILNSLETLASYP